ncbi:putative RNA methyltransferase [Clostridia bacterium]|nr:putative RNA methyltransferase [Clostridia bacterium]
MVVPNRNDEAELTIESLSSEAQGVARLDGFVWFVQGALPGERVRARVIKPGVRFAVARMLELIEPSPDRAHPPCPYYVRCGGCVVQHMTYESTLCWKTGVVRDCLERIGGIQSPSVNHAIGIDEPWRYRSKGAFPVAGTADRPTVGCYAPRSHEVIDAPEGCLLQNSVTDQLVRVVRSWMIAHRVEPYNEMSHKGCIRHVVARVNRDGESMLTLVINSSDARLPHADDLIRRARDAVSKLKGVSISPNPERGNVIFGKTCETLWGEDTLSERLELDSGTLSFEISPRSFFQVNTRQAERLVNAAVSYAGTGHQLHAVDVYCGTGTLTLALAKAGFTTVGIELLPDAVENARRNAIMNHLPDVRFECGDAAMLLPKLVEDCGKLDVVTLDPPRKGCDRAVLEAAVKAEPNRLVYVSCDPATLARDAAILTTLGYRLAEAKPIDQFCWTSSIETAALFVPV